MTIRNHNDLEIVARKARRWRDHLKTNAGRQLTDDQRLDLAHVLDELQQYGLAVAPRPRVR
jgi:hypothetical protein